MAEFCPNAMAKTDFTRLPIKCPPISAHVTVKVQSVESDAYWLVLRALTVTWSKNMRSRQMRAHTRLVSFILQFIQSLYFSEGPLITQRGLTCMTWPWWEILRWRRHWLPIHHICDRSLPNQWWVVITRHYWSFLIPVYHRVIEERITMLSFSVLITMVTRISNNFF